MSKKLSKMALTAEPEVPGVESDLVSISHPRGIWVDSSRKPFELIWVSNQISVFNPFNGVNNLNRVSDRPCMNRWLTRKKDTWNRLCEHESVWEKCLLCLESRSSYPWNCVLFRASVMGYDGSVAHLVKVSFPWSLWHRQTAGTSSACLLTHTRAHTHTIISEGTKSVRLWFRSLWGLILLMQLILLPFERKVTQALKDEEFLVLGYNRTPPAHC